MCVFSSQTKELSRLGFGKHACIVCIDKHKSKHKCIRRFIKQSNSKCKSFVYVGTNTLNPRQGCVHSH